jgi:hypothetical protein
MRLNAVRRLMRPTDETTGNWIKSSLSSYTGDCVEVQGLASEVIRVRDSKNPRGGILSFTVTEWDAFIGGVHNGEFDRQPRLTRSRSALMSVSALLCYRRMDVAR